MENEKEVSEKAKTRQENKERLAKMDIETVIERSDMLCNSLFINARRNTLMNFKILQAKKLVKDLSGEKLLEETKEMLQDIISQL